ncbi:MAG: hypothetical protein AB7P04_04695 [Bacteriovoracia bacterium]
MLVALFHLGASGYALGADVESAKSALDESYNTYFTRLLESPRPLTRNEEVQLKSEIIDPQARSYSEAVDANVARMLGRYGINLVRGKPDRKYLQEEPYKASAISPVVDDDPEGKKELEESFAEFDRWKSRLVGGGAKTDGSGYAKSSGAQRSETGSQVVEALDGSNIPRYLEFGKKTDRAPAGQAKK